MTKDRGIWVMTNVGPAGATGCRIEPLYSPGEDGGIVLYAGDLELSSGGSTWLASGDIELRLGPRSSLVANFAGQDRWIVDSLVSGDRPAVALPQHARLNAPTGSAVPVRPDSASQWGAIDIPINKLDGGRIDRAERLVLHFRGRVTDHLLPTQPTSDGKQGQLPFNLCGWELRLAEATGRLSDAEFATVIEAIPSALPMDKKSVGKLVGPLFVLLSFIAGTEVGIAAIAGLDAMPFR
jgi:hypothetical protein